MVERAAKDLAKNPLGIIALFIVLVYSIAALALGLTSTLTSQERIPLIWFLVVFPVLVLAIFCWLVSHHHQKLYAPGDYKSDEGFLNAAQARHRVAEIQSQQDQLQSRVRETLEKVATSGEGVETIIAKVQNQISQATTITVDARKFTGDANQIETFPIAAFDTIDALADEVYFRLHPRVKPFEYGYTWVLRNEDSNEVIKTSRMITKAPAGKPITDSRALAEVGIQPGTTLVVEKP